METIAAIAVAPGRDFEIATVDISRPAVGEVLVAIAAVGICHTDIAVKEQHLPVPLPAVLGHEGAGIVVEVGEGVAKVKPGDRVCLTFASCGCCPNCMASHPAYCENFNQWNGYGKRPDGSCTHRLDGNPISGMFFGQSSFAALALAHERNVVLVPDDLPMEVVAPLGCGVQTGAGAVLNALDCPPGSTLLVVGGGTVGLSAALAGLARGCASVLVSEPSAERRKLALDLGVSGVLDPAEGTLSAQVGAMLPRGVDYVLDTTGSADVIVAALECLAIRGKIGLVGMPRTLDTVVRSNLYGIVSRGITIRGIIEGDSDPDTFIPELIDLYRSGRLPIDRLIRTYPLEEINVAVEEQLAGQVVKPVLLIDRGV